MALAGMFPGQPTLAYTLGSKTLDILIFLGVVLFAASLYVGNKVHADPTKQKAAYSLSILFFFSAAFLFWLSSNV